MAFSDLFDLGVFVHLDLLTVGVAIALLGTFGCTVYFHNTKSVTGISFLLFSLATMAWGFFNYFQYQLEPNIALVFLRFSLFFAVWQAFFLFLFFWVFPEDKKVFSPWLSSLALIGVGAVSILTLTPYALSRILSVQDGRIASIENGPFMPIFGLTGTVLVLAGLFVFAQKAWRAGTGHRRPYIRIFFGAAVTFALIIAFNLVFPAVLNDSRFISLGALFILPLALSIAISIARDNTFSLKVSSAAFLVCGLAIITFIEIILARAPEIFLLRSMVFILVLVAGIGLIRSVVKEVQQRELIEKQEQELEVVNAQQESLLHFISHEVKGYLTKSEAAFAAISTGDYGAVSPQLQSMSEAALVDTRKGVDTVIDILDASNLKRGTMALAKESFDIGVALAEIVRDLTPVAKERGLDLSYHQDAGAYTLTGDADKMRRHVFRNIVDNSIRYTRKGSVRVHLSRTPHGFRITVTDTGVGITPEDMKRLFTEGGKGAESLKINAHSTGYGLYIAKMIVEGHGGTIHAQSAGADKGSEFIIDLPSEAQKSS